MAHISEEEDNYIRLALLLKELAPKAIRSHFDKVFPPTYLPSALNTNYNTLQRLKFHGVLNHVQWNLLFPRNGVPDSNTFDLTLMICLIRNLTCIIMPINGFDCLPHPMEKNTASDLARIKWYRNYLAHHNTYKIDISYFNSAWSMISDALIRLSDQYMNEECQDLKVRIIDQSNQEIMVDKKQTQTKTPKLRQTMESVGIEQSKGKENLRGQLHYFLKTSQMEHSKVSENLENLQDSHHTLKMEKAGVTELLQNPIPRNIKEQIKEKLEEWKENDKMFIETNGAKSVLRCIKDNGCVMVIGSSGTGKSSVVQHVALQMQKEGYDILPVSNPVEISNWYNPNKNLLFVVDDFCGRFTLDPMIFANWKKPMEKIKALVEKRPVKLILSCRLQIYKEEKMETLSFYQSCTCDLLSEDMCLLKNEQQSIAELYLKTKAYEINELYNLFDYFPLMCKLYSKNTKLSIVDFFENPFTVYTKEIDKLRTDGVHVKYCALALCVMFNNCLKEKWLLDYEDKDIRTIITNTYEACKVDKGTSNLVLHAELDTLIDTFIRKDDKVYLTIHDKLFDFLAFYFGNVMMHCLIENASSHFINERFLFENKYNIDDFMIIVPERYQQIYIDRMVRDWSRGNVVYVFCNKNMDSQIFTQRFLANIKRLALSNQKTLAGQYDKNNNSTPLTQCCYIGNIDLVTWCLYHCGTNVNHCSADNGEAPLIMACQEGHSEIVQMLLINNADINKCTDTGESPLFIACQKGQTEIVRMLIKNNANINKSDDKEVQPLFIACQQGHTGIARMLIDCNADINKCTYTDESPLFVACEKGQTEIVRMLINNRADINKCRCTDESPLFVACEKGHTEIVRMLTNNNADINKCTDTEESPLFIACQKGQTEIVQILINNMADINRCTYTGESPLFISCKKGLNEIVRLLINYDANINTSTYTEQSSLFVACQQGNKEIVQVLIDHNADINKSDDKEVSPLCIACQNEQTEIVKMLVESGGDINKCTFTGESPLFIACRLGNSKIVQMLINKNVDLNMCTDTGESPLFISCKKKHTKIVRLLAVYGANLNACTYTGESPLYIACQRGNSEIVQMLSNHNADINMCTDTGESPLFISCKKGHTKIVQLLAKYGANLNTCTNTSESPLSIACQKEHTQIVQMIIEFGGDINKCTDTGESPLFIACQLGNSEILQMLIASGGDINKCIDTGESPLFIACQLGNSEIVRMLINNNADINKCTDTQESPMFIACKEGHTRVVHILINNKADINMCTDTGESPLYISCKKRQHEIVRLLADNGANMNTCKYTE